MHHQCIKQIDLIKDVRRIDTRTPTRAARLQRGARRSRA
jgi:hypothetical protein